MYNKKDEAAWLWKGFWLGLVVAFMVFALFLFICEGVPARGAYLVGEGSDIRVVLDRRGIDVTIKKFSLTEGQEAEALKLLLDDKLSNGESE